MTDFSYDFESRLLRRLGFTNLRQLDTALAQYDDNEISAVLHPTRQGQLSRLDDMLTAAMGMEYLSRHMWSREPWMQTLIPLKLGRLRDAGIEVGTYRLEQDATNGTG
jgi:hypothetical protein